MIFNYHPDIRAKYPNLTGGIIVAHSVQNGASSPELLASYQAEQQATLKRIGDIPLSQIESLAAWRAAFRRFGVDPTQIRSACEALLRRLTKQGDIPSINALVDIGNLVSIRYALPVAIVDIRSLTGEITVRFADGTENFTNLGQEEIAHPDPGEVIFVDDAGLVFARRWCWRQSAESAAREDTTDLLVTVEAQHEGGRKDLEAALNDLSGLLQQYTGGTLESELIGG